jgi:adenosyl cobinamide kinase/adenosyl cobinamide phosphate guanylyltransferase
VISNEVGLGIHPETELGRTYRDTLGRANRSLAAAAEISLFVTAGKVLRLQDVTISW